MSETTRKQSMAINNWTTAIFCIHYKIILYKPIVYMSVEIII